MDHPSYTYSYTHTAGLGNLISFNSCSQKFFKNYWHVSMLVCVRACVCASALYVLYPAQGVIKEEQTAVYGIIDIPYWHTVLCISKGETSGVQNLCLSQSYSFSFTLYTGVCVHTYTYIFLFIRQKESLFRIANGVLASQQLYYTETMPKIVFAHEPALSKKGFLSSFILHGRFKDIWFAMYSCIFPLRWFKVKDKWNVLKVDFNMPLNHFI